MEATWTVKTLSIPTYVVRNSREVQGLVEKVGLRLLCIACQPENPLLESRTRKGCAPENGGRGPGKTDSPVEVRTTASGAQDKGRVSRETKEHGMRTTAELGTRGPGETGVVVGGITGGRGRRGRGRRLSRCAP